MGCDLCTERRTRTVCLVSLSLLSLLVDLGVYFGMVGSAGLEGVGRGWRMGLGASSGRWIVG